MSRILHVWNDYSPVLFDQTHPICLDRGLESYVVCCNYINNDSKALKNTIIFRYRSPKEMTSAGLRWKIYRLIRKITCKLLFKRFLNLNIRKIRPDILHFHFGNTAADLIGILNKNNIPIIVSFYGVDASALLMEPEWVERYKYIFYRAKVLHVLCDEVVERFVRIGCPREKLWIWNLPPNIENYPYRDRDYNGTTRFLIAARFVEKKGHGILLRAYRKLLKKNKNVHLTMFGYGPSEWLVTLINDLDLNEYVTLINNGQSADFVSSYNRLLDKHDIFLAPSTTARDGDDEGGPALTMICAQSSGLPVISTPFPGAEISLIDDVTGYFCKQDDEDSLYSIMLNVCDRPGTWRELGLKGSKLVIEKFSVANQSIKLMDVYKKMQEI